MWTAAALGWLGASALAQDTPDAQTIEEKGRAAESFGTVPDPPIESVLPQPRHQTGSQEPASRAPAPDWWKETREALAGTAPAGPAQPNESNSPVAPRSGMAAQLMRTLSWLLALCGIIVLGGYALRRYGKNTPLLAGHHYGVVLAKVYLGPRASLHYVKSGGRILLIGLTPNHMSLIAEFEADAFEGAEVATPEAELAAPGSFLDALRAAAKPSAPRTAAAEDDELATLRGDVQRLQRYLRDSARESAE